MAKTGGPLEHLCDKHHLNSTNLTIPVMKMVGQHRPETEAELVELINSHNGRFCHKCKCKGNGNLRKWANRMFDKQAEDEEWRKKFNLKEKHPFDLEDCVEFFYELFVVAPIIGIRFENKAQTDLQTALHKDCVVRHANHWTDTRYGVDLEIGKMMGSSGNRYIKQFHTHFAIQVKSKVYKNARHSVREVLKRKHREYGNPVYFLHYDELTKEWDDFDALIMRLRDRFPYLFPSLKS